MTAALPERAAASRTAQWALVALFAGGAVMGLSPIFVRIADVGPLSSGFFRLILALPVLLVIAGWGSRERAALLAPMALRDRMLLIAIGLAFGLDIACWHLSITYTTVAEATLLAVLTPAFVAIGAWFLFNERFGRLFLAGLVVAMAGTASLVLQKETGAEPVNRPLGILFGLGAALGYSAYMLGIRKLRRTIATPTIVLWTTGLAAVSLLPVALASQEPLLPAGLYGWSILLAMAVISHAGGQTALTFALAHLPASFSSVTQLMQAAVAALAAWLLLGEALTWMKVASAITILAGIWICRTATTRS